MQEMLCRNCSLQHPELKLKLLDDCLSVNFNTACMLMQPQYTKQKSKKNAMCRSAENCSSCNHSFAYCHTGKLVNVAEDYLPHSHIISLGNLSLGGSVGRWKNSHKEVWSKRRNVFVFTCHPSERFQKDFRTLVRSLHTLVLH